MHHYTDAELEGLLALDEAVDTLRDAFSALAQGDARVQLRTPTDAAGGFRLNTMAAIVPSLGVAGAKVYTAYRSRFSFVILLFSLEDGRVLASFDAGALTRLRTAATSVLAAGFLARGDSKVLTVFGTGTQAEAHTRALAQRFPLEEIRVVGRANAAEFAARMAAATGIPAQRMEAVRALDGADLVVTATRTQQPLFHGDALPEGCTLLAIGSARPDVAEVDPRTIARASRIVVESLDAARHEAGDLLLAARDGTDPWAKAAALGELCAGRATGRTARNEITMFESVGLALEDVAIAARALRKLQQGQHQQ